jgi:imidazolonepropionase-like amidohydrolase
VLTASDATLAGAVLPLDGCVRTLARAAGVPVGEAAATVTTAPADMLRLGGFVGCLDVGAAGDVVLLDAATGRVTRAFVGGVEVVGVGGGGGGKGPRDKRAVIAARSRPTAAASKLVDSITWP